VQRLGNDPAALARSLRANSTGRMRPLHHDLAACTMPVALIAGADDEKFVAVARDLADAIPTATVHVIDGAGHAAHLEQPDAVIAAILATQSRA
jgi:2-succinyl-6-hydroxy-2,4-cyclohexadiene-1-carboxylate synthase